MNAKKEAEDRVTHHVSPITEKEEAKRWGVPKGYLYLLEDTCKGCGFCYTFCPKGVLAQAEHFNAKGYHPPEVVDADACVMCRFCEAVCPEFAIWLEEEKEESYGQ
jgi:2-oxoglutarate ferredoxin oxidoreductase subunit delta